MSFIGRNPNVDWINLVPRSADPTSPNEGDVYRSDGTVRPEGIWEYRDGTWQQIGSASDISNYIPAYNSNFEGNTGDWATYADAAGAQPVDGTGGTASIVLSRTTVSAEILNGTGTAKIAKGAVNEQGEGVSLVVATDNYLRNKPVRLSFNYSASTNFVYGSSSTNSDIMVFVYDVDNAQLITPFPNWLDGSGKFVGSFQATSGKNYRVILHVATTSALAYDFFYDNVFLGEVVPSTLSADSDWQSYTPTITGFGSPTNISFAYKKDGPDLLIRGSFTSGTPTAVEARVTIPSGLVAASNLQTISSAGIYYRNDVGGAAAGKGGGLLKEPNVSYFTFMSFNTYTNSAVDWNAKALGTQAAITSGDEISIQEVRIPIQGWTSGFTTAETVLQNVPVTFQAVKNGGSATADTTIATWTTVNKDSVGAFNSTTGVYTVRIPGDYQVNFNYGVTVADTTTPAIRVNGTVIFRGSGDTSSQRKSSSGILYNLRVGDIITATISGGSPSFVADATSTSFSIAKIESPNASINIPKVAYLKDVKAAATEGGSAVLNARQTRVLNTETDPFGIVTLSSNQFTLQPGTYEIEFSAPAFQCDRHKAYLRNVTDSVDSIIGSSEQNLSADSVSNKSFGGDIISITSTKTFEIQHFTQSAKATNGLGTLAGNSTSEVYTQVKITKIL